MNGIVEQANQNKEIKGIYLPIQSPTLYVRYIHTKESPIPMPTIV